MNKQDFLEITFQNLQELSSDTAFRNNLSQVRARAIQEEFVSEESTTRFTFDAKQIWKSCDYLVSESLMLLSEDFGNKAALLQNVKIAAEAFESLAKFLEEKESGDFTSKLSNLLLHCWVSGKWPVYHEINRSRLHSARK